MKFSGLVGASVLAMAVAFVPVGAAQAQSIPQALAAAYDHAPELQAAVVSAKQAAERIVPIPQLLLDLEFEQRCMHQLRLAFDVALSDAKAGRRRFSR